MDCFMQKVAFKPNLEEWVEVGRAEIDEGIFLARVNCKR